MHILPDSCSEPFICTCHGVSDSPKSDRRLEASTQPRTATVTGLPVRGQHPRRIRSDSLYEQLRGTITELAPTIRRPDFLKRACQLLTPRARAVHAVDSHTAGEPTRVILAPVQLPGKTIAQKRDYFRRYYDHLRRLLMAEPRGHRDMFGAVITQPTHPDSDVGVFYMDNGGYLNMCIHGSIGVITTVLQLCTPKTTHSFGRDLTLDTPAGTVHAQAFSAGGRAMKVVVRNVPSFVYAENVIIRLPDLRSVRADIVFAGNFFALVDPKQFHLRITKSQITTFAQLGVAIKAAAREQVEVCHPLLRHISQVDLVEFCEDRPQSHATTTLVVFGRGQIDRSPCGTGTCAYMALAHHRGRLRLGQSHRHCGILGTIFEGSLVQETQVGPYCAVVPQVCGSAYITGFHEFIVECGDPLPNGFLLE